MRAAAVAIAFASAVSGVDAQRLCKSGFVWREAFAGDVVCVTPATRAQAAADNRQAAARRQPGGGAYGPSTCRPGYVWRAARADDLVCVTPAVREQTARDNAAAPLRVAGADVRAGGRLEADAPARGGLPLAPAYTWGAWSAWARAGGVEYRYRWGLDRQQPRYARQVDAVFEMRNRQTRVWQGAARSIDCQAETLAMSRTVTLRPNETKMVKFLTPNCGTPSNPWFRPNVVRSVRID
jgi:hypothetical protein